MTQSRLNVSVNLSVFSNLAFIVQWFREEKPNEATNKQTKQEANKNKGKQTNEIGEGRGGGGWGDKMGLKQNKGPVLTAAGRQHTNRLKRAKKEAAMLMVSVSLNDATGR